jgi:hypothetical protein
VRNGGGGGGGAQGGDERASRSAHRFAPHVGRELTPRPEIQNQGNNLHVSGIARNIDERMLEDLFNTAGKVSYQTYVILWDRADF